MLSKNAIFIPSFVYVPLQTVPNFEPGTPYTHAVLEVYFDPDWKPHSAYVVRLRLADCTPSKLEGKLDTRAYFTEERYAVVAFGHDEFTRERTTAFKFLSTHLKNPESAVSSALTELVGLISAR